MTRQIEIPHYGTYSFPDDDPRSDAELIAAATLWEDTEFARLKAIRDAIDAARMAATEAEQAARRAAAPRVIATGSTGHAIGGAQSNGGVIGA